MNLGAQKLSYFFFGLNLILKWDCPFLVLLLLPLFGECLGSGHLDLSWFCGGIRRLLSMGVIDECHYNVGVENGVSVEVRRDREGEAIEDAVRVLLQGLGEDTNREGLRKTPLRVAEALRDGTRGES